MELELRSHRWTDATRRESRSLSSAGRGEALSGTRFTPLSPRSTRCFSHSSCARAHKRDRIWRENPARRFHVRDQNFLSGEVLCRAGACADRTGQKWVVAVKTSLPVIDYRATFLIPRQFASFPFFLSYRMDRFIVFGTTIAFTVTNENVHRPCDIQKNDIDILSSVTSYEHF